MDDVVDVYQRPYAPTRPVVCLDEASTALHDLPCGRLPVEQGQPRRQDDAYDRHGGANRVLMSEPLRGWRTGRVTERRTRCDRAAPVRLLSDEEYPQAARMVLVVDTLTTHGPKSLDEAVAPEEAHRLAARCEWQYTPEHGSWRNIAECERSVLQRQCLNRPIPAMSTLTREVSAWEERRHQAWSKVIWHCTTADARIKLRRLYPAVKEQNLT